MTMPDMIMTTMHTAGRIAMLDDFFVRSMVAGIGVALVAGPLGCFVVWRRMAYFGDTLAHGALLGVALGLLMNVSLPLAVFAVSVLIALALLMLQRQQSLGSDALLGLLSHAALALGLVVLALITWVRTDIMALLFGDILSVSKTDIAVIWIGGAAVLGVLALFWRRLFAATVSREIADAEGMKPELANFVFMILMASVVAIAMKITGALLITAMLVIPAATARRFAAGPETMALMAAGFGAAAVAGGLGASLEWDIATGPAIVVAAFAMFAAGLAIPHGAGRRKGD